MSKLCDSCVAVYVHIGTNEGIIHEKGCPKAFDKFKIECLWCGIKFLKNDNDQEFCSSECFENNEREHNSLYCENCGNKFCDYFGEGYYEKDGNFCCVECADEFYNYNNEVQE